MKLHLIRFNIKHSQKQVTGKKVYSRLGLIPNVISIIIPLQSYFDIVFSSPAVNVTSTRVAWMKIRVKPLKLPTRLKFASLDWLFLDFPGTSGARNDLKLV